MRTTLIVLAAVAAVSSPHSSGAQPDKVGPEFIVPSYTTYRQDIPRVCGQQGGDFVVVWTDDAGGYMQPEDGRDGAGGGVFARRFDSQSNPLTDDFAINAYTTGSQRAVEVMCMDNGRFAVLWYQFGDGFPPNAPNRTKLRAFEADGTPIGDDVVTPDVFTVGTACEGPGNEFLVLYREGLFFGQRFDDTAQPIGTPFDVRASQPYGELLRPSCCGGDSGFVVSWEEYTGYESSTDIVARRLSSAGEEEGAAFRVNSYTTGYQQFSDLDCNDNGSFVVTWSGSGGYGYGEHSQDGDGRGVIARRFDSTGDPLGDDFVVNEITADDQWFPAVAADDAGNFVVSWTCGGNYTGRTIHAQAFDSLGDRIGTEFTVNTDLFDLQENSAVAARGNGEFVVAWDAVELGFNEHDVRAQRISLGDPGPTTTTTIPTLDICGDPVALVYGVPGLPVGRAVTATDALFILRAAVGSETCELCACDTNGSGSVTASDALIALSFAVGQPVELMCPPCG